MQFLKEDIEILKKHESQFVSLKYPSLFGQLKQIDLSIGNVSQDMLANHNDQVFLRAVPKKAFIDPFRSLQTSFFLCENVALEKNVRSFLQKSLINDNNTKLGELNSLILEMSFWLKDSDLDQNSKSDMSYLYSTEPDDIYANLRSDIIDTLENINVQTAYHYHGAQKSQCVIAIKGDDIIDLADNYLIAQYIIQNIATNYGKEATLCSQSHYKCTLIIDNCKDILSKMVYNIESNLSELQKYAVQILMNDRILSQNVDVDVDGHDQNVCKINFTTKRVLNPYIILGIIILCCQNKNYSFDQILENGDVSDYLNTS